MENAELKDKPIILTPEDGSINIGGDPKAKWYVRAVTGKVQLTGIAVLFVMLIITVAYTRAYGWAGFWKSPPSNSSSPKRVSTGQSTGIQRPVTVTHEWSETTYLDTRFRWRCRSEPVTAVMEIRQTDNPGYTVVLDGKTPFPKGWSKVQWRLIDRETIGSALLTFTKMD